MTFDWHGYLVLAEYLYNNCDTFPDREACMRASISRSYYAAFCTARNYARDFDRLTLDETGRDHRTVSNHYIYAQENKARQVGNALARLRDIRNEADYKDTVNKIEQLAKTAIVQSQQVHTLLKQIYGS